MNRLSLEQFRNQQSAYDQLVGRTDDIDRFCSTACWVLPAHQALSPDHEPWLWRCETTPGYVALSLGTHEHVGRFLQPMEASWGLANAFIGPDPQRVVEEFVAVARACADQWDILFLTGIDEGSTQFRHLVRGFHYDHFVGIGPAMGRQAARLDGGFEGFLSRRSSKFRANLRRAMRGGDDAGVRFDYVDHRLDTVQAEAVYERALAVERHSWKGRQQVGIATGRMRGFYGQMLPCLGRDARLRVVFARLDGVDIGYCFGGIFEGTYRGLQMSYHDDFGELSPGNLVQLEMIQRLCDEGITTYDMGQAMDYKARWTDDVFETIALVVRK